MPGHVAQEVLELQDRRSAMPDWVLRTASHFPKNPADFLSLEQTRQEEKLTNGCKTEAERRLFL
jgi:hypothetical protein